MSICPGCHESTELFGKCDVCGMHLDSIEDYYTVHCSRAACASQIENRDLKGEIRKLKANIARLKQRATRQ